MFFLTRFIVETLKHTSVQQTHRRINCFGEDAIFKIHIGIEQTKSQNASLVNHYVHPYCIEKEKYKF